VFVWIGSRRLLNFDSFVCLSVLEFLVNELELDEKVLGFIERRIVDIFILHQ
jgi:hypothetical protein